MARACRKKSVACVSWPGRRLSSPIRVSASGVSVRHGKHRQAISHLKQALALYKETGSQYDEITAQRTLAEALHGAGQPAAARAGLAEALQLAAATGNAYQQASAHCDLAESHHSTGQDQQSRRHWQQALTLYTQLGAPEADQIRSRLSAQEAEHAEPRADQATG